MKYYIIQNKTIVNFILAESKEIAEQVTQLKAIAHTDKSVEGHLSGTPITLRPKNTKHPKPSKIEPWKNQPAE